MPGRHLIVLFRPCSVHPIFTPAVNVPQGKNIHKGAHWVVYCTPSQLPIDGPDFQPLLWHTLHWHNLKTTDHYQNSVLLLPGHNHITFAGFCKIIPKMYSNNRVL